MIDRNSNGRQWSPEEIAAEVAKKFNDWRGITIVSVIMAESGGFEWIRPMVLKDDPGHPAHLSIDRGICQFNSYWWAATAPDKVAFTAPLAIALMCDTVASDNSWGLDRSKLDWWTGYKSMAHLKFVGEARKGMNVVRQDQGLDPL